MARWDTPKSRGGMNLIGDEKVQRFFRELEPKVARRILGKVVRAGAKPIIKEARNRAPKDSGLLKKSIGVVVRSYKRGSLKMAIVGVRKKFAALTAAREAGSTINPRLYAHLVEFGSKRQRAYPFIRPAWDTKRQEAFRQMALRFEKSLREEAARLKR